MQSYVGPPITEQDRKVLAQVDGHWCNDWDGLAVSAWTPEYDCCVDFDKTLRGRIINWFFMKWFYHMEAKVRKENTCNQPECLL
jgi:hypothetical protein